MLDATSETKTGLDAVQIAALRKADRVAFFHRATPDASGETSYVEAIKRALVDARDPFARDAVIIIPCDWRLMDYTRDADSKIPYGSDAFKAFEMIHGAQYDDAWKTTASLLRVGDALTLLWSRGAFTTEGMQNASPKFYGDTLHLRVTRGEKVLTFHIDTSICEDNCARMIRPA